MAWRLAELLLDRPAADIADSLDRMSAAGVFDRRHPWLSWSAWTHPAVQEHDLEVVIAAYEATAVPPMTYVTRTACSTAGPDVHPRVHPLG